MELLQWQRPLLDTLLAAPGLVKLVALPTGAGKTYLVSKYAQVKAVRPLVICPRAAISTWKKVLAGFHVEPHAVINWEQLKTQRHPWWHDGSWHIPAGTIVVIDEVHKGCSGPDSAITKMAALLKAYPVEKVLMSATPASSPLQMRAIGYLLDLHGFTKPSFYRWCLTNGCFHNRRHGGVEFVKGKASVVHMGNIRAQIGNRMLYAHISEIPGFPESFVEAKLFDVDESARREMQEAYDALTARRSGKPFNFLSGLQLARQKVELLKVPLLEDLVRAALEEGTSPVVFVCFRETLELLAKRLRDVNPAAVLGAQNEITRGQHIDEFQNNLRNVCLCTIDAGGVAISLHDVHNQRPRVSFLTPSWSASHTKQALGRIHRTGGTPVTQTFVLAAGTVEEKVYDAVTRKLENIEALCDDDLTGSV